MKYAVKTVSGEDVKLERFDQKADADTSLEIEKGKLEDGERVHIHKCYHDESENKPCEIIEEWENKGDSLEGGVK